MPPTTKHNSAFRLRIGVILLLIWWIPFWAIIPAIINKTDPALSTADLTSVIIVIQTIIGIIGGLVAGKEVTGVIKSSGLKQTPKLIWRILWHGNLE